MDGLTEFESFIAAIVVFTAIVFVVAFVVGFATAKALGERRK